MGSGPKRKGNDVLRVNSPQKSIGTGSGGNGDGSSSNPVDINQRCPQAFQVTINPKRVFSNGTAVTIRGKDLFIVNENVGKLSENHLRIISNCGVEGIRYIGRVLNKGTKTYARFEQNN